MNRIMLLILLLLVACNNSRITETMKNEIAESFKEKTGYDVMKVSLLRTDGWNYTGYVTLYDSSQAMIDVIIDKDNPSNYLWKCTQQSPTMLRDKMENVQKELRWQSDSIRNALKTMYSY